MRFFVAGRITPTNVGLVDAFRRLGVATALLPLEQAYRRARPGDAILPRLDIVESLDGVEPGLDLLHDLDARGVVVVNGPGTILAAHDKLLTALKLGAAGIPHPRTIHVDGPPSRLPLELPVVVKPRFGSWGIDVCLCRTEDELAACLEELRDRTWFRRQGALVQELVPPRGHDLRVLVVDGAAVGAVKRVAAAGEWRTNIALGGHRVAATPPPLARQIAVAAAAAVGGGFVGVDLLPTAHGFSVVEVNGCVDFTADYGVGFDVHVAVAGALVRLAERRKWAAAPSAHVAEGRFTGPAEVPALAGDLVISELDG